MDNNHTDDYVLVLEDRTEVKNEAEVGKLSVVSDINEKGKLKTAPAEEAQQSSFLKFSNKDGLLKNFMTNFLKQFKEPKRFGLYKVLAENVEPGVIISKQRCKTEKSLRTNSNLRQLKYASMTSFLSTEMADFLAMPSSLSMSPSIRTGKKPFSSPKAIHRLATSTSSAT